MNDKAMYQVIDPVLRSALLATRSLLTPLIIKFPEAMNRRAFRDTVHVGLARAYLRGAHMRPVEGKSDTNQLSFRFKH